MKQNNSTGILGYLELKILESTWPRRPHQTPNWIFVQCLRISHRNQLTCRQTPHHPPNPKPESPRLTKSAQNVLFLILGKSLRFWNRWKSPTFWSTNQATHKQHIGRTIQKYKMCAPKMQEIRFGTFPGSLS